MALLNMDGIMAILKCPQQSITSKYTRKEVQVEFKDLSAGLPFLDSKNNVWIKIKTIKINDWHVINAIRIYPGSYEHTSHFDNNTKVRPVYLHLEVEQIYEDCRQENE
jgi:hypothetical protein